jgi:protocatechuate 3,4-dioxygenase beta subunit
MVNRFMVLLLFVATCAMPCFADVCVYRPPNMRLVAGTTVDSFGHPIPGVTVMIIRNTVPVATATTDDAGIFRFDRLKEGAYELAATANGFQSAHYKFVLHHPTTHWNRSLEIELAIGLEHCGGAVRVVKAKKDRAANK